MADGAGDTGRTGDAGAGTPDPRDAEIAALKASLESANVRGAETDKQVKALQDTVRVTLQQRAQVSGGGSGNTVQVTPQLRANLRMYGLTDPDIDNLAPSVLPFLLSIAPEFLAAMDAKNQPLVEADTFRDMLDDGENFPHAKTLRREIKGLLKEAKEAGRPMSLQAAYHTAVSMDVGKGGESRVAKAEAATRAESASTDLSATSGLGHRASSGTSARASGGTGKAKEQVQSADLSSMSREERMKFYEANGDVPVAG